MRWVCQGMLPWWSDAWERREEGWGRINQVQTKRKGIPCRGDGRDNVSLWVCGAERRPLRAGRLRTEGSEARERGEAAETTLRHVQRTPALQTRALRIPVPRTEASSRMQLNTLLLSSRKPCLVTSTVHRVAIWFTFWSKLLILDNCSSSQPAASQWLHISDHWEEVCLYPKNNGKSQKNFFFIYFY